MTAEAAPRITVRNHSNTALEVQTAQLPDQLLICVRDANGPDRPSADALVEASCTLSDLAASLRLDSVEEYVRGELDDLDDERRAQRAESLEAVAVWLDALRLSL